MPPAYFALRVYALCKAYFHFLMRCNLSYEPSSTRKNLRFFVLKVRNFDHFFRFQYSDTRAY